MAKCGGIVSQQQIVMGKVVTDRVFKRQLDMLQVGVRCDIDSEPCAGEVTSIIKADKMLLRHLPPDPDDVGNGQC